MGQPLSGAGFVSVFSCTVVAAASMSRVDIKHLPFHGRVDCGKSHKLQGEEQKAARCQVGHRRRTRTHGSVFES